MGCRIPDVSILRTAFAQPPVAYTLTVYNPSRIEIDTLARQSTAGQCLKMAVPRYLRGLKYRLDCTRNTDQPIPNALDRPERKFSREAWR